MWPTGNSLGRWSERCAPIRSSGSRDDPSGGTGATWVAHWLSPCVSSVIAQRNVCVQVLQADSQRLQTARAGRRWPLGGCSFALAW